MRNRSLMFARLFFTGFCITSFTTYMIGTRGTEISNIAIGVMLGLALSLILIGADLILTRLKLRTFQIGIIGLLVGYLMGKAILLIAQTLLEMSKIAIADEPAMACQAILFLCSIYLGVILTYRSAEEWYLNIPFIKLKPSGRKKKDVLIDWSILTDSRIIDIASSGLLDDFIIIPRFMINELYVMQESSDDAVKSKAKRCLEVLRKLESIPSLELRYSETDFPETKDCYYKLIQLARLLDANILTADIARLQQYSVENTKIINIHILSNALKPIVTGEQINIKIQRYGKEPRQGVGYLDDGTMVVVNGGAEFIGETIKAQVLSVKHTSSGRMIFCNVMDEDMVEAISDEMPNPTRNYFTV